MIIQTENLGKRFNREWIFKKLNFTFEPGKTYAIVGPNGSGKSTLLQVLWGQVPQSTGTINYKIGGAPIVVEEVFCHMAIATPYMELIEEFTLEEMIQFHFKFKPPIKALPNEEIIEMMELGHAKGKQIINFSSGMKQRLKLGLAFFSDTRALFLDEPTSNLDKNAIEWYQVNLNEWTSNRLTFIASNVDYEYPQNAEKIHLLDLK